MATKSELDRAVKVIEQSSFPSATELDTAIETINRASLQGQIDVELPENPIGLAVVLAWFGMGIFIGLMIAGIILQFTDYNP